MLVKKFIVKGIQEKADKYEYTIAKTDVDKDWCEVVIAEGPTKVTEKAEQYTLVALNKQGEEKSFQSWIPKSCRKASTFDAKKASDAEGFMEVPDEADALPFN